MPLPTVKILGSPKYALNRMDKSFMSGADPVCDECINDAYRKFKMDGLEIQALSSGRNHIIQFCGYVFAVSVRGKVVHFNAGYPKRF